MASQQIIKRRIKSVSNTKQITKAMQLVAASKLRKAQDAAIGPKDYVRYARTILENLSATPEARLSALFQQRPVKKRILTIVITSDRGLAGAFNANVMRAFLRAEKETHIEDHVICIGKYASDLLSRISDVHTLASYHNEQADEISQPVYHMACQEFVEGRVDEVRIFYTKFYSTVRQEVVCETLLPVQASNEDSMPQPHELEPNPEELMDFTLNRLLEAQVLQSIVESQASEQASRMLAMKNATDNATELIDDLTLEANKLRQAIITQELAEISAGAEAMK